MRGRTRRFVAPLLVSLLLSVTVLAGCDLVSGGTPEETAAPSGSDAVKVSLSWGESVDLDLEIWDEDGREYLASASWYDSDDVTDGSADEYFLFTEHDGTDYGTETYTVSVLYAGRDSDVDIPSLPVTLTIESPDGSSQVRNGTVFWDVEQDQWHAFRIDGATGNLEDVDEHVAATPVD